MRRLVIASRGSPLALAQARIVSDIARNADPDLEITIYPVKTVGDRDRRPFGAIGGRGLFVAEVERAVVEGRADIAVHSAKDLTAEIAEGCTIICFPARGAVEDVVVGGRGLSGEERLAGLPAGATVGTSSMRRRALLSEAIPGIEAVDLRGNLDTRLRKVAEGVIEAAVLAAAGLDRLGVRDGASLDTAWWVPPPGQGALAVQARSSRTDLAGLFESGDHAPTRSEVECERAFATRLEGGCSVPLGCLARATGRELVVTGYLGHPNGAESMRDRISGSVADASELGDELAGAILRGGGAELREEINRLALVQAEPP